MPSTADVTTARKLHSILSNVSRHWVGNGFPVQTLFSYQRLGKELSPFLLLDHAGPAYFEPTAERRGVGEHPHRGFETVTIVFEGEVEHRDSSGAGGRIGPGDVQWMTAASGLVHEEFHSREFSQRGGTLEAVQLWVNLPAKHKMSSPRYQAILSSQIPTVKLPGHRGSARIIAGELAGVKGPAKTFTPMNVWDLRLSSDQPIQLTVPEGHTAVLVVLKGSVRVNGSQTINAAQVGLFEHEGENLNLETQGATALLLSGEPIDEPIVGSGPFVMNTTQEIQRAVADYQSGKMGHL